jgi:hypothetical protein
MEKGQPVTQLVAPAANDQNVLQKLSLVYGENAKVAATFWEWRHKLMERFFYSTAGIVLGTAWIYKQKELSHLLFVPPLLGCVYCIVSYLMDRVNSKILLGCYKTGKEIEQQLGPVAGAYSVIFDRYERVNYTVFLRALYLSSASLFLAMSGLAAVFVR